MSDDGLIPTLVLTGVLQNAPRRARCPDNNSVVFSPQQKVKSRQCYFCSRNSQNTFIPIDFTVFKIRIKTFLLETLFNTIKEERKRDQYYIDFTLTVQNRAEQVLQILLRTKLDLTLSSILATVEEKKTPRKKSPADPGSVSSRLPRQCDQEDQIRARANQTYCVFHLLSYQLCLPVLTYCEHPSCS